MSRRNKTIHALIALLLIAVTQPGALQACTACYGANNDSVHVQGMGWGILALLFTILSVLAGVALFFVHVGRRTAALAAQARSKATEI